MAAPYRACIRIRSFRCAGPANDLEGSPEASQFGQSKHDVNDAESGNSSPNEIIEKNTAQVYGVGQKNVVFPESRPRYEHKEKTDLEAKKNKGDGEKAIHVWKRSQKPEARSQNEESVPILASGSWLLASRSPYYVAAFTSLIRAALPRRSRM